MWSCPRRSVRATPPLRPAARTARHHPPRGARDTSWRSPASRVCSLFLLANQPAIGGRAVSPIYQQPIIVGVVGQTARPNGLVAAAVDHGGQAAGENYLVIGGVILAVLGGGVID